MTAPSPTKSIDVQGTHASTELLETVAAALSDLEVDDTLEVFTDDFAALDTEMRSWSHVTGHELIAANPAGSSLRFLLRKGAPMPTVHRMAIVVSSDQPSLLGAPMGIAKAAALEGLEVSAFFRDAGVRVLSKSFRPRRRLRSAFSRGERQHPHHDIFRLYDHGVHIYACALSMEDYKVEPDDLLFSSIVIAEYATMVAVMEESDINIVA